MREALRLCGIPTSQKGQGHQKPGKPENLTLRRNKDGTECGFPDGILRQKEDIREKQTKEDKKILLKYGLLLRGMDQYWLHSLG